MHVHTLICLFVLQTLLVLSVYMFADTQKYEEGAKLLLESSRNSVVCNEYAWLFFRGQTHFGTAWCQ
jgi:hypothetical protein